VLQLREHAGKPRVSLLLLVREDEVLEQRHFPVVSFRFAASRTTGRISSRRGSFFPCSR
jgi:hypothetical protein